MLSGLRRLAAVAVAVSFSLVVLTPAAANADRWSAPDDSGDVAAWQYSPEPAPCGTFTDVDGSADANDDITKLVVRHTPRAVQVVVHLRDLDAALEQSVSMHFATPRGSGWFLDVDRFSTSSGAFRTMSFFAREIPEPDPEAHDECGGVWVGTGGVACRTRPVVDPTADTVRATVPRTCLGRPAWVRVGVESNGWTEPPGDGTYGGSWDEWGTREEGASTWLPPFGPEVPASGGATSAPTHPQRTGGPDGRYSARLLGPGGRVLGP